MTLIVPATRPKISQGEIAAYLSAARVTTKVALVGIRGYYTRTMGDPTRNDRNIYDDCIAVFGPGGVFKTFNANTDPSHWRKGIASLAPGLHMYRKGKHGISRPGGGYPALRPATPREELPVRRDGILNPVPGVAINIHKGSKNTTSSAGCQTVHPSQWDEFITLVYRLMDESGQKTIPYLLIEV